MFLYGLGLYFVFEIFGIYCILFLFIFVEKYLLMKLVFMLFVDNVFVMIWDMFLMLYFKFDRIFNKYKGKFMFVKGNNLYDGDFYINLFNR